MHPGTRSRYEWDVFIEQGSVALSEIYDGSAFYFGIIIWILIAEADTDLDRRAFNRRHHERSSCDGIDLI